jgi:hypothetical protein
VNAKQLFVVGYRLKCGLFSKKLISRAIILGVHHFITNNVRAQHHANAKFLKLLERAQFFLGFRINTANVLRQSAGVTIDFQVCAS